MSVLIGLDIGTSKICASAISSATGALESVVDAPNDSQLTLAPPAAEQDAKRIVQIALDLLSRLAQHTDIDEVDAIGVTGQMHGVVIVDSVGEPLTPLTTWQDGRGMAEFRNSGRSYVEELAARLGADALEASGCYPATGFGAVTLLRMVEEGVLPARGTALTIHDLVVRVLCGAAITDPTDAASWGVFDVRHGARWLSEAGEALNVPAGMLPEVLPTGSVAGRLLPGMARQVGLPDGIPVAVALGDNQASFTGSVPAMRETALLNLGTGGQMSVPVDRFVRAQGLDTRPLTAGQWLLVGASLCGGRAYEILERFFASVGRELFGVEIAERLYDRMNSLAAGADRGGLKASTLFEGARLDPAARGSVTNLSAANFTAANLTRSVVAGMVEELAAYLDCAKQAGAAPRFLSGSGNAVRRNPVVREQIEKQIGMPLHMAPHPEEAAIGAALTAGVAAEVYAGWAQAGHAVVGFVRNSSGRRTSREG